MEDMDEAKKYQRLVAALLIKLRTDKGYSGIAFADIAGVAQSTYQQIESENSYPKLDTLVKICKAHNLTLNEFTNMLEGQENKLIIEGLTPNNKESVKAIVSTMKNLQKLPPETQAESSGLTNTGKDVEKLRFKKENKRQKEA